MSTIKLLCGDNVVIETNYQVIKCSSTLKHMLRNSNEIRLHIIRSTILSKILEWALHHKDDPSSEANGDVISPWDANFLQMDFDTLLQINIAAKYLNITRLVNLTKQKLDIFMPEETVAETQESAATNFMD